jgi:hypothetical protein
MTNDNTGPRLLTIEDLENAYRWKPHTPMTDAEQMGSGQRVIRHQGKVIAGLPPQEFELAIDPNGHLARLCTRTNGLNSYDPKLVKKGADQSMYRRHTMDAKRKSGWLMIDRPPRMYIDDDGNERKPTIEEKRKLWPAIVEEANKRRTASWEKDAANAAKSETDVQRIIKSNAELADAYRTAAKPAPSPFAGRRSKVTVPEESDE